jgi:hypothetical protein
MADPFELQVDPQGRLVLKRQGQDDVADVRVRRAFPWSQPDRYYSVRASDGRELLLIEEPSALAADVAAVIDAHLEAWSFVPRIQRVENVDMRFGYQQWTVQTDRGPAAFRVQEREDVRFLADGRFSIKDADGNVYELPRVDQLDEQSVKQVEKLL